MIVLLHVIQLKGSREKFVYGRGFHISFKTSFLPLQILYYTIVSLNVAPAVGTLHFRLWLRVSAAITALP